MVAFKDGGRPQPPEANEATTFNEIDQELGINFNDLWHNVPGLLPHDPGPPAANLTRLAVSAAEVPKHSNFAPLSSDDSLGGNLDDLFDSLFDGNNTQE